MITWLLDPTVHYFAAGSEAPFLIFQRLQLGVSKSEAKGVFGKETTGNGE